MTEHPPLVSVVLACRNNVPWVAEAVRSVLAQTMQRLELIVVGDDSSDDSAARALAAAGGDRRVRATRSDGAGALAMARGAWIALMDGGDMMHPRRLEELVAAAEADGADIVADDVLVFDECGTRPPRPVFHGARARQPCWTEAVTYLRLRGAPGGLHASWILRPLIRAGALHAHGLDLDAPAAADPAQEVVVRLLVAGARLRTYPALTCFRRAASGAVAGRLSAATLAVMAAAEAALAERLGTADPLVAGALAARRRALARAMAGARLAEALRRRDWGTALAVVARRPATLSRLAAQRPARKPPAATDGRNVCVLSRQRVIGNTNGSSAYLLNLCETMAEKGFRVHLVCPSPGTFGRWPALLLKPEMGIFRRVTMRGAWRVANVFIARDPSVLLRAVATVLDRVAARLRLSTGRWVKPAPYVIGAPWTRDEFLFVARHAPACADVLIGDYAFLTEAFPYALRPDAPRLVVMHDLFSSRPAQFERLPVKDSVIMLDEAQEMALLSQADAVIAIQDDEAALVRSRLPDQRVMVTPMAVRPVPAAQPGEPGRVLFVGSKTAPNIIGLRWFVDLVWPSVRRAFPQAELTVVGSVAASFDDAVPGLRLLGRVANLAPLYRRAAVVVSPLPVGSGLKIKLVEAFGHGKAVVATKPTLQGIEPVAAPAVELADDPREFARALIRLLSDPASRIALGEAALDVARSHFAAEACHAELTGFLDDATRAPARPAARNGLIERTADPAPSLPTLPVGNLAAR